MIYKAASNFSFQDVKQFVENKITESKYLDYKEEFSIANDSKREDLVNDLCAFANSGGGHLIFGVKEQRTPVGSKTSVPESIVPFQVDDLERTTTALEQILNSKAEPRLPGVQIKFLESDEKNKYVLVISTPQSWLAPHTCLSGNKFKFAIRTGTINSPMDYSELKRLFLSLEGFATKLNQFKSERVAKLLSNEGPFSLNAQSLMVIHLFPISNMLSNNLYDVTQLKTHANKIQNIHDDYASNVTVNLDGVVNHSTMDYKTTNAQTLSYTQVFRNGAVEVVDAFYLNQGRQQSPPRFFSPRLELSIVQAFESAIDFYRSINLQSQIMICISLLNVKNFKLLCEERMFIKESNPIDRTNLFLPDQILEFIDKPSKDLLKPTLDSLWNAFGYDECVYYKQGSTIKRFKSE